MENKNIGTYAAGAGAYYGMVYGLIFFPSLVFGIQTSSICRDYLGQAVGDGHVWGIIVAVVFGFFIMILQALQKLKLLLIIYAVTLWPFLNVVRWIWHTDEWGYFSSIPFPGIDWFPW